jgi:P4 family phage/plasmid primase-like protien
MAEDEKTDNSPKKKEHTQTITTKTDLVKVVCEDILNNTKFVYDKYKNTWRYNNLTGLWLDDGEDYINSYVRRNIQGEEIQRSYIVNESINRIKGLSYIADDFPAAPSNYIAFNNCVYDLKTQQIIPFRPDMYLISKAAVILDPHYTTCDKINQFISEVVSKPDSDKLLDWSAYTLYREYIYQKFLALYGRGLNGKGIFLNVLEGVIGNQNISAEALKDICKGGFSPGYLWSKWANIFGDMPYGELKDTSIIKKLTGNDTLMCNRKHKTAFPFKNYAKLIFSTNELPQTADKSHAFYRRVALIEFPNDFSKTENRHLREQLLCPEEMSGFAWKMIARLQQLYNDNFTMKETETIAEIAKKWEDLSNPILKAVGEKYDKDYNSYEMAYEVYGVVDEYCNLHGVPKKDPKTIKNTLESNGIERFQKEGKSAYRGLKRKQDIVDNIGLQNKDEKNVKNEKNQFEIISTSQKEIIKKGSFASSPSSSDEQDTKKDEQLPELKQCSNEDEQKTAEQCSKPIDALDDSETKKYIKAVNSCQMKNGNCGINQTTNFLSDFLEIDQESAKRAMEYLIAEGLVKVQNYILSITAKGMTFMDRAPGGMRHE